jgi:hypothetical protein
MSQEVTQPANPEAQTVLGLTVRIMSLTKTLRAYYEQHQANSCSCLLCKAAEREFRMTE